MWNMESGNRQVILWGSTAPPLSTSQVSRIQQTNTEIFWEILFYCIADRVKFCYGCFWQTENVTALMQL